MYEWTMLSGMVTSACVEESLYSATTVVD